MSKFIEIDGKKIHKSLVDDYLKDKQTRQDLISEILEKLPEHKSLPKANNLEAQWARAGYNQAIIEVKKLLKELL